MPLIMVRNLAKRALVSMGLSKSGDQTVPQNTVTVLAPMVVDNDYPQTVMNGTSGVRASTAGEWQVTAQCTWTTSNNDRTFRLLKNGTSIASTASGTSNVTVQGVSVSRVPVVEGDVLALDVSNGTLTSTARVVSGGAGTFLRAKAIPEGSPADVGMNKTTSQSLATASVYEVLTGWTADAAKPGSSVSSNGLVMTGAGNVTATVQMAHANTSSGTGIRVKRNGTIIDTFTVSGTFHTTTGGTTLAFPVVAGDLLTVEAMHADFSNRSITSASLFTTISM